MSEEETTIPRSLDLKVCDLRESSPGRLLGIVDVLGTDHYFEAVEVKRVPYGDGETLAAVNPEFDVMLDDVFAAVDGCPQPTEIAGRMWVVSMVPFCD